MNDRYIVVFDYETASPDKDTCQIIQIGAVAIHPRTLKIVDKFSSWVNPDWDDEVGCTMSTMEWHAQVRKIKTDKFVKDLKKNPDIEIVWPSFVKWVDQYNLAKNNPSGYNAPVPAGYNIIGFDMPITNRYCERFGQVQKGEQRLFSRVYSYDLLQHMWFWTENINDEEVKERLKLAENIKTWMGFSQERIEGAHDAMVDVQDTAAIIIKMFKMQRYLTERIEKFNADEKAPKQYKRRLEMKDCFKNKDKA